MWQAQYNTVSHGSAAAGEARHGLGSDFARPAARASVVSRQHVAGSPFQHHRVDSMWSRGRLPADTAARLLQRRSGRAGELACWE
jgi:hypothetical protein